MTRRHWIVVLVLGVALVACLLIAAGTAFWLVRNVPGAARLVYGDPASPTPEPTMRPTFTPLVPMSSSTLEPVSTASFTATPIPSPAALPSPVPTDPGASPVPTEPPSVMPTPEPTETLSPTATTAPPTQPPKRQWIVFETERGERGDYEIFVMPPDGSSHKNLTHSWADDLAPVWSPDGRRIAFVSFRDTLAGKWGLGQGSIYLMDFDPDSGEGGGNVVRLTPDGGSDAWPTWSPDGQRLGFASDRSGNWDIWVINVDGSGLVNLTDSPDNEQYPAWSPDGRQMAFTSGRSGNLDVWLMNVDEGLQGSGSANAVNLTQSPRKDRYAMWSPDGKKIAFNTNRDGNQEIYVMNADGSNPVNITNAPDSAEGLADWSPNGKRLALYSDRPGNKDVFVIDLGGGDWANVTNHRANDEFCTWSP